MLRILKRVKPCASLTNREILYIVLTVFFKTFETAGVMELVDVPDSKSGERKLVWVRFPPPAEF